MLFRTTICAFGLIFGAFGAFAQSSTEPPHDWFLLDPESDHLQGVSAEKVYSTLLKGLPSRTVVVAVIDGGTDVDHEDLKNVIWINEKEIPGNGIDDDNNGYIDDIHGWNFIGGKTASVNEDTYELTREFMRLNKLYEEADPGKLSKTQKTEYDQYKKIKDKFERLRDKNKQEYDLYRSMYRNMRLSVDTLKATLKVDSVTTVMLDTMKTTNPDLAFAKGFITALLRRTDGGADIEQVLAELKEGVDYYKVIVEYGYNTEFDSRLIVGDTYRDLTQKYYGNNDVKGPDAKHGTHVAGIIGADRKNDVGIKGIADNVRIMAVRAVPNGDERDKDVANAIRYAVDNGARVINMSFGKSFSPEKELVDQAVKYADSKGVILVHAAGNESENNDHAKNFPTRVYQDGKEARNWLEVGASAWGKDDQLAADFSNYGKKSVDLFAPGVKIYSTTPGNTYESEDGTSMASPAAAGVAALLVSYFPDLTPGQVIDILRKSSRKFDGLKVQKPGGGKADFSDLSNTGGLINAYDAVKMALALNGKSTPK